MRDYAEISKALLCCHLTSERGCAECPFGLNNNEKCANLLPDAADAIEELLAELERYRHAAFVIGEACVEESKCHISPEDAIKKIRENIYYSRQMPISEPPKEVVQGEP